VLGNFSLRYSLRFWQAPHPWMFVPATLSMALAMGCAIRSTRSPSPLGFGCGESVPFQSGESCGLVIGFGGFISLNIMLSSRCLRL